MSLLWKQLLCWTVLLSAVSSQGQTTAQEPHAPPDEKSVHVFLTVSDTHDSPVTPAQSELSVFVDKQLAQVDTLRSAKNDALLFAVLLDTSKSEASSAAVVKKAALQLFQGLATNGNQGYLVPFSDLAASSRQPLQVSQVESTLDAAKFEGGTAVYDAIQQTCIRRLSRSGNPNSPRRVILLISDGEDNASHVPHDAVEETAEKEGVAVFSLIAESSGRQGQHFLKEVSQVTGGRAITVKDPTDAVAPLLTAIENQWSLSFVPAQPVHKKVHSLSVKTSQDDIRISAPGHIFVQ